MNIQCKCGKTYISKTTDLLINGSSQPLAANQQQGEYFTEQECDANCIAPPQE
jgi:hypothetical protein